MTDWHQRDRIMKSAKYVNVISIELHAKYQQKYSLQLFLLFVNSTIRRYVVIIAPISDIRRK